MSFSQDTLRGLLEALAMDGDKIKIFVDDIAAETKISKEELFSIQEVQGIRKQ